MGARRILVLSLLVVNSMLFAQRSWFIAPNGSNDTGDGSIGNPFASTMAFFNSGLTPDPGDTVFYRAGDYYNSDYASTDFIKNKNTSTIRIKDFHGTENAWITVKPYQDEKVVIYSNSTAGIFMNLSSYVRIEGFEISGESDNLINDLGLDSLESLHWTYYEDNTVKYKVPPGSTKADIEFLSNNGGVPASNGSPRPTILDTDGIMIGYCDNFEIVNNYVHHMPNEGIRSFFSDYQTIVGNEVHDCSKLSSNGVHGLSVYNSNTIDNEDVLKIYIANNTVYDNWNYFISFNEGTSITPHIDEGRGITIQRCTPNYGFNAGRILIENNITWGNGNGGYIVNEGMNVTFRNNTSYHDQATTLITDGEDGCDCGFYFLGSINVAAHDNIIILDTASQYIDGSRAYAGCCSAVEEMNFDNNITNGYSPGWMVSAISNNIDLDPQFVDPQNHDFALLDNSPAINAAVGPSPSSDHNFEIRDNQPDIGAIEFTGVACPLALLGPDQNLCSPSVITLDATTNGEKLSYEWLKDGLKVSNEAVLNVIEPGAYEVIVNGDNCPEVSDEIQITSSLIDVVGDVVCEADLVNLEVLSLGDYAWYAGLAGGNELAGEAIYEVFVSETDTFYVQDNTAAVYTFGKTAVDGTTWRNGTGKYANWGREMELQVETDLTLKSFDIDVMSGTADVLINISGAGYNKTFSFDGLSQGFQTIVLDEFLAVGVYTVDLIGTIGEVGLQIDNNNNNSLAGIISFSGTNSQDHYGYFYNWVIGVGNTCDRTPVVALVDQDGPGCTITSLEVEKAPLGFYPNPTSGIVNLLAESVFDVYDITGVLVLSGRGMQIDLSELSTGAYILKANEETFRIIKE